MFKFKIDFQYWGGMDTEIVTVPIPDELKAWAEWPKYSEFVANGGDPAKCAIEPYWCEEAPAWFVPPGAHHLMRIEAYPNGTFLVQQGGGEVRLRADGSGTETPSGCPPHAWVKQWDAESPRAVFWRTVIVGPRVTRSEAMARIEENKSAWLAATGGKGERK